ncbi:MAG: 4-phosphopantoate--beta-alanine ligase [Acidobacteria bacterium]|nr:4-phosphopantoate--beta-alanine ligase [Acidobacteriota bacterium]
MSDLLTTVPAARAFCEAARARGAAVGLVPTMGALHDGHRSLLRQSLAQNDVTVVSIFVNPLQFGAGEDLEAYPRGFENDLRICAGEGAAAVFAPSEAEMYPQPPVTSLDFGGLSASLEGACRPGHLAGVGLVVAKLFAIVGACRAYFGEKDWQQLAVVRRLADDLSRRNAYLGADERAAAGVLHRCLLAGAALIEAGERASAVVEAAMASVLAAEPLLGRVDYARVVDAATLARREPLRGELRLMVAAHLGGTRLIDNLGATVPPP